MVTEKAGITEWEKTTMNGNLLESWGKSRCDLTVNSGDFMDFSSHTGDLAPTNKNGNVKEMHGKMAVQNVYLTIKNRGFCQQMTWW